ncbi:acyl-CoA dehydrogenase family protein [Phytopseudomonas dryadis]|uniref:Peptide synthetase n=1 Tax=Phytopseudomonas dryadis TaxID=2487520 RepID=A0A4V6MXB3_9GAMM|nr:acyl-CoA dehydrogenase family protein [Pseudomonas dryadis]TBU96225.1 peptide synthetase [Pseudomonas dryadis]
MIPAQYLPALALEQQLGDPRLDSNLLSYANALSLDEQDAFPEEAVTALNALGLPRTYVPEALGGTFRSCEGFIALGRTLARRNMSVAVAYSTMLWSTLGWIGGTQQQRHAIAHWMMDNASFPCLAYSEAEHGADLVSNQLTATRNADGNFTLDGEKWPINRAIRSDFLVLLARTDSGNHMRNHSLFIIRKDQLHSQRYYYLPRVKTHGLKGCDISGIGFRRCVVPESCLVGQMGHGLELALKGFQITRTFCTSLSLGVGDTALRVVADYAARRVLYGTTIDHLPHNRDVLANSYLSQLVAECVTIVSARGLHVCPQVYASWSSIAKVQVCKLVDHACTELSHILGARFYMRDQQNVGIFQKFFRDGAIVSIFDGSSHVCLDSLATLLDSLAREGGQPEARQCMEALFDLGAPLTDVDYTRLTLFSRHGDPLIGQLPYLVRQVRELSTDGHLSAETLATIQHGCEDFMAQVQQLCEQIRQRPRRAGGHQDTLRMGLAKRYCSVFGIAACVGIWLYNRDKFGTFFASGQWLLAVLERGLSAEFGHGALAEQRIEALLDQLGQQRGANQMLSLFTWPLACQGAVEQLYPTPFKEDSPYDALIP